MLVWLLDLVRVSVVTGTCCSLSTMCSFSLDFSWLISLSIEYVELDDLLPVVNNDLKGSKDIESSS